MKKAEAPCGLYRLPENGDRQEDIWWKVIEMRAKGLKGFTLIELLVVIAIISLLVSILLPSLTRAKELAKRAVCCSNLKGAGIAMYMYADDEDESFVTHRWLQSYYFSDQTGIRFGLKSYYIAGYLGDGRGCFCPEDEQGEKPMIPNHTWMPGYTPRTFYGYGYNGWANTPPTIFNPLKLSDVPNPSGTIGFTDKMWNVNTLYHGDGANAVFIGGHAEWIDGNNGQLTEHVSTYPPYYGGTHGPYVGKLLEVLAGNAYPDLFPAWVPDY